MNITFDTVFNSIDFIASDDGVTNDDASSAIITKNTTTSELHSTVRDRIFATESSVVITIRSYNTVYNFCFDTTSSTVRTLVATVIINLILIPLHIIDHRSVVYLILLQIRFYDQQDSLLSMENDNDNARDNALWSFAAGANDETNTVVSVMAISCAAPLSYASPSNDIGSSTYAIYDEYSPAGNDSPVTIMMTTQVDSSRSSVSTAAITIMTTVFNGRTGKNDYDDEVNAVSNVVSNTIVPVIFDAPSYVWRTITSNELPSAIINLYFDTVFDGRTGNNDNYSGDITVPNSNIVTLKTYDTTDDLYFDTVVVIIVTVAAPAVAVGAPSVVTTCNIAVPVITKISFDHFDEDSSTVSSSSVKYNEYSSIGNNSLAAVKIMTIMMTTVFHELSFAIHDGMTYNKVYDLYFDATCGTPFHIIGPGSVLYLILLQILSSRQFDQITSVLSTALSLHRTLCLIITYLLLLISNPYFDTISLLMYIHLMMYILHQGSVLSYENGFNPLNGDSPLK